MPRLPIEPHVGNFFSTKVRAERLDALEVFRNETLTVRQPGKHLHVEVILIMSSHEM